MQSARRSSTEPGVQPVLGFWTDSFPIYQERRRPYIAVAMVGSLIVNLLLAYAASRLTSIAVIILLLTLGSTSALSTYHCLIDAGSPSNSHDRPG